MCKDCWFSKYNRVLLHYSVSMTAAAAAAVAYIPLSAAYILLSAAAAACVPLSTAAAAYIPLSAAYIPLSAAAAAAAGGGREEEVSLGVIIANTEIKFHILLFTLH